MKVAVLFNSPGPSSSLQIAESEDDTRQSASEVCDALKELGHAATLVEVGEKDIEKISLIRADFIFNLVEWSGRETTLGVRVVNMLERMGIAFSGSGSFGYEVSCNKFLMKKALVRNKIPTAKYQVLSAKDEVLRDDFVFPVIVKPVAEHCGIGISQDSVCKNIQETRNKIQILFETFGQPVLVEEFIEGRELHVTVLEKNGKPWVLPPAEVIFKKKKDYFPILSYDAKWKTNTWEWKMSEMVDAKLDASLLKTVTSISTKAFTKLGGADYTRLDFRVNKKGVYVLEINNNPGIGFDLESGIGRSARRVGFDKYSKLIDHIVKNAVVRWSKRYDAFAF